MSRSHALWEFGPLFQVLAIPFASFSPTSNNSLSALSRHRQDLSVECLAVCDRAVMMKIGQSCKYHGWRAGRVSKQSLHTIGLLRIPTSTKKKVTYLYKLLGINLAGGACTDLLNNSTNVVIVAADTSLLASVLNFFGIKVAITI